MKYGVKAWKMGHAQVKNRTLAFALRLRRRSIRDSILDIDGCAT
jgi:hypothetical protein